ncbi:magnesium chelatase family protein [Pararhizobium capsulatum DSM 1112]|uniref:Magnesium chelatase family protein n=2 Tax=Pararhizobium capsulatum TaxID=34014 RepID=A0ABU0BK24_9HYPH|nr:magnesium chelatase family protein [Pararhizobium capsulatum DSM 1112]
MAALGAIPADALSPYVVIGELNLDGTIASVAGALPAAIGANALDKGLICPADSGPEAAWAGADIDILAPRSLIALANHFRGTQVLSRPEPAIRAPVANMPDLADIKGQESAKRALEVAAAGNHNLLMAAMIGGGLRAKPGEASLAHNGVLFLDEFPEFTPQVLDALRQPLETAECVIARANHRVTYPAAIQLVAAMNPCRCGMAGEPGHSCARGPRCASDYQARISGPLLDRIDIRIDVPAVTAADLIRPGMAEGSSSVAARVARARELQRDRFLAAGLPGITSNARCTTTMIEVMAAPDASGLQLLRDAAEKMRFSARGYHRILKVARTLADLDGHDTVGRIHIAEAISYRMPSERLTAAA